MPSANPITHSHSREILLVEDSVKDVFLIREAFRESGFKHGLQVAKDGSMALQMLRHEPPYEGLPVPDLVLLDINMPVMGGIEVLEQIKLDSALKMLPVVMLTTSQADSDVRACYQRHANGYLVKPADYNQFVDLMQATLHYWLDLTVHPPGGAMA